jgi:hypothetical protein
MRNIPKFPDAITSGDAGPLLGSPLFLFTQGLAPLQRGFARNRRINRVINPAYARVVVKTINNQERKIGSGYHAHHTMVFGSDRRTAGRFGGHAAGS